jgi:hypothetical protein
MIRSAMHERESGDTVGAVAIDETGLIAVGISTGGLTAKMPGRVGDSPLVGKRHLGQKAKLNHAKIFFLCTVSELFPQEPFLLLPQSEANLSCVKFNPLFYKFI